MKLGIATYATQEYSYALKACLSRIVAAAGDRDVVFVLATDTLDESFLQLLPTAWDARVLNVKLQRSKDTSTVDAFLVAQLHQAAFDFLRAKGVSRCWSVESDVLVPSHALDTLEWVLEMPGRYYGVSAGTYDNGLFIGGFGEPRNPIYMDFTPKEREIPKSLRARIEAHDAWVNRRMATGLPVHERAMRIGRLLADKASQYPPDGDIYSIISKHGWRKRGWLDFAYPAIGQGCVVPVDWTGMGCTLMGEQAFLAADMHGFNGNGTNDLFLCYERWARMGIRIGCSTHVLCDHVKKSQSGGFEIRRAFHEDHPDMKGHIRKVTLPWMPL